MSYSSIRISKGSSGWGPGFVITPAEGKDTIISVTGGGIHPVAQKMADLSGAKVVDGFTNHIPDEQVMAAVINCGGTARIGVYPKKRIPTVDVFPGSPGGPLERFITEDIFVSDVGLKQVTQADGPTAPPANNSGAQSSASDAEPAVAADATGDQNAGRTGTASTAAPAATAARPKGATGIVVAFGNAIGYIINTLLSSGRQALDIILKTVIPFMAYVGLLIGFVNYTGISELIANAVTPLAQNPFGLILLSTIVALPFLSPILGPGAAIAQVVGVLMGTQIGAGALPVHYALPTLFAIDGQVGADFIPVGLSLGEAKPETISVGVPAILFTRLLTSPIAVVIAYFASLLL
ncbi:PTS sorbitol transporter subunit IIB [Helcobacillus sp. ACRRO]|uniref:PTS glucitol/sorbitol transporter subunit IIB n=1 Tax=Helcobacillus sp. ACRRO TaxID=2918202 RepID=UPI001EF63F77|nr:PTS sorbitol transporter subunit IIB [Helcobacillus sp. ACRRO]MCG7428036.1 PTS sorbitol transporter subunit IIB [Helcobacillus sp. ACRRO]